MQAYFINLQKNPMCLPLISQKIADKTQTTNPKTTLTPKPPKPVFLCEIIQPAAFLCALCVICERISRKSTQSVVKEETPISLADLANHADKPQNHTNHYLSFLCVNLRNLRETMPFTHVKNRLLSRRKLVM